MKCILYCSLALFLLFAGHYSISQTSVTRIYTDHNGFLVSSASSIQSPDPTSQNLLAFQTGSTVWSTGVNDAALTANSVVFTPLDFQAMPATSTGGNASALIGIGRNFGGYTGSNGCNPVVPAPHGSNISSYLTDGPHGLDISTGIFNIGGKMNYTVSTIHTSSIGDGVPDIIVTQIGDLNNTVFDNFRFKDAANNTVGNQVNINFTTVNTVMRPYWKFYNLNTLACGASATGTRDTRVLAFDFADLGITISNYMNISMFEHNLTPNSDVAFVAYNTISVTILPATLVGFNADLTDREVRLNWQTASEQNSDYFLIEKSQDGIAWEEVSVVKATGNSSELLSYEAFDKFPYTGKSYYRLRLVDNDGSYTTSTIVAVKLEQEAITIFPNPASDLLSIEGKSIGKIMVFDVMGKDVTGQVSLVNVSSNFVKLDINKLTTGLYLLHCNNEIYQLVKK